MAATVKCFEKLLIWQCESKFSNSYSETISFSSCMNTGRAPIYIVGSYLDHNLKKKTKLFV